MMSDAHVTTDHAAIRQWVEARGGRPAAVKNTGAGDDPGILRINFPGSEADDKLEDLSWDAFFDKFEDQNLAFLHQDELKDGAESRFFKLVNRDAY
ncbi:hypothetical protein HUS23_02920 [Ectothiorhodospiraceae bacterium 2226]|nr:hypothetical protein HUS23_02920 [Ectothiorhodospiraceae bacterium 2226]